MPRAVFLVEMTWWRRFTEQTPGLGRIQNAGLLDSREGCDQCTLVLRRDLRTGVDFMVVNPETWDLVRSKFGADYCLRRLRMCEVTVVKSEVTEAAVEQHLAPEEPRVDLYPFHIQIYVWSEADGRPRTCRLPCGHPLRLYNRAIARLTIGAFKTIVMDAIQTTPSVIGSIATKSDILYWNHKDRAWHLWRSGWTAPLTQDGVSAAHMRVCVRKKMTKIEVAGFCGASLGDDDGSDVESTTAANSPPQTDTNSVQRLGPTEAVAAVATHVPPPPQPPPPSSQFAVPVRSRTRTQQQPPHRPQAADTTGSSVRADLATRLLTQVDRTSWSTMLRAFVEALERAPLSAVAQPQQPQRHQHNDDDDNISVRVLRRRQREM